MSDLGPDVLMFREMVNEIESDVADLNEAILSDETREQALISWATLEEAYKVLAGVKADLAERLAAALPDKTFTVENVGTFEVHRKTDRKAWDKDLYRAVLDTILVNPNTGEIVSETESEKLLKVWNLGAPRVTALRERGLDPDEWAEVEYGKQTLRLIR